MQKELKHERNEIKVAYPPTHNNNLLFTHLSKADTYFIIRAPLAERIKKSLINMAVSWKAPLLIGLVAVLIYFYSSHNLPLGDLIFEAYGCLTSSSGSSPGLQAIKSTSSSRIMLPASLPMWYIVLSSLNIYHSKSPVVNTHSGKVQGIVSSSRDGNQFFAFRAIPFAKPPLNELRFEAPEPPDTWEGVRDVSKWSSACLQFDALVKGTVVGEEDCLYLNVFTPNITSRMPVLAYIHGGGFTGGESMQFDPKYFMDHDVVVVTFNYRLASLGFLNTGDELIRGNMGLKDQNMALRWIHQNIENFGGDKSKVTLFGESAGGASVHYHVISPLSRGLFQRAIMQSGNVACPWALTRSPQNQALRFGKLVNCPTDNTTVLVQCLKKMDGKDVVKPHVTVMSPVHTQDDFFPGSVEAVQREDTFLAENPFDMLERGDFAKIPVIFGVNAGEGGLKTARLESYSHILDELDTKWDTHVPVLMHYDPNRTEVSDKLREYYMNSSMSPSSDLMSLTRMLSDGIFFEPNYRVAKYHAKHVPTYLYYYTYLSSTLPSVYSLIRAAKPKEWYPWELNIAGGVASYYADKFIWRSKDPKKFGACHAEDILQLWSFSLITDIRPRSGDYNFSNAFVSSFVDFAQSKSPLKFNGVEWPTANPKDKIFKYINLSSDPKIIDEPFHEGVKFIESLKIRDPHDKHNW